MKNIDEFKHIDITNKIIKAFYEVYNCLGYGFLENVYQNALFIELAEKGFKVEVQKAIKVYYKAQVVGKYIADMVIDDAVILELKAVDFLTEEHEFQIVNYLRATDIEVGLLLNFGKEAQIKRKAFDNENKNLRKS